MTKDISFSILLILWLIAPSAVATAADGIDDDSELYYAEFQPNPSDQRIDYFAPDDFHAGAGRARDLIHSVEKNHLIPGRRCVSERKAGCARSELDFVLRWVPNHPRGLSLMSQFAVQHGTPGAALPYLDFAVQHYPEYASTYIIYGIHRYRMDQYSAAEERLRQALQRDPESASAHYNLGLALFRQERFAEASEHAHRAYDLGYPLPGLKRMLRERGHWAGSAASTP